MLRVLSGCLMIVLPLLATHEVGKKKASGDYISYEGKVYYVLMYLDLAMYVLVALALATLLFNTVTYVEQRKKTAFTPALVMTICAVVVTVINLGVYKTDMQQKNEAFLAQSLQSLEQMASTVNAKPEMLKGYWAQAIAGEEIGYVMEFATDDQLLIYIRNTGFQKDPIGGIEQYEVTFHDGIGELWTERFDVRKREYIRFLDENTIITVYDNSTGFDFATAAFKTDFLPEIEDRFVRLTETEFEELREQTKLK